MTQLALQAILSGAKADELPPQRLLELAQRLGNNAMEAMVKKQSKAPATTNFQLPEEPDTAPAPVPDLPLQLAQPTELTTENLSGRAFDPAVLSA